MVKKQNIKLLEGRSWMVFVNQYTILDGKIMSVIKWHVEDNSELDKNEWVELQEKIEHAKTILSKIFDIESFNIGFNVDPDSGSSVKHFRLQIMPRVNHLPIDGLAGFIVGIQNVHMSPAELKEKIEGSLQ